MKMFLAGSWQSRPQEIKVINPYDGQTIDVVPKASLSDVETALASASEGTRQMRKLSGFDRWKILLRACELVEQQTEELARTISLEEGKILAEARFEVSRAVETLRVSAEEAKRIAGEMIPLDGAPGTGNRMGFTLRVPCGVVLAISPFNFPLNLMEHKVGRAVAAGNSIVLKSATYTSLSALKLTSILLEAGLPPLGIQCITGSGSELGKALCSDGRVRKITFTGSRDVGEQICRQAGIKKVTMELGSNAPLIIMPDADLAKVCQAVVATGYSNAGQVCISAQRVLALKPIYEELIERLKPKVQEILTGNPLDEKVAM